ncbi:hypothetical protein V3C99_000587, partial [Haemonchus contortus]
QEIRSSVLYQRTKITDAVAYAKKSSDAKRTPERPPAQCPGFFTKALSEGMLCLVSLKPVRSTGPLGLATGASGDVTGARSSESMINGTTGGTGE